MLMVYLERGLSSFIMNLPISFILLWMVVLVKYMGRKRERVTIIKTLLEFMFIHILVTILEITGILYGSYQWPVHGYIEWGGFNGGFSVATLLNLILFVPFGFFLPLVFEGVRGKRLNGLWIGLCFSCVIECLQLFTGRFVQVEDVVMNTLGTGIGFGAGAYLLKICAKRCSIAGIYSLQHVKEES